MGTIGRRPAPAAGEGVGAKRSIWAWK